MALVEMKNISKQFSGMFANRQVNFTLEQGEIHALLGENGAGKSTLMNILAGVYSPDDGEIYVEGEKVRFVSPLDAIEKAIGMVHQHFMLVQAHTVLENIILGLQGTGLFIDKNKMAKQINELADKYNFPVDPLVPLWQLSVGEQQRVEILKALIRNARILILDEPTAVLTPRESRQLFKTLNQLKKEGRSAIFITHKLEEVMAIADRITILRGGRVVATVNKQDTDEKDLASRMVGRDVLFDIQKSSSPVGEEILRLEKISALNDKGIPALKDISFSVSKGEILGVAGVSGNGQKEMAEVISGLRKPAKGKVTFWGEEIQGRHPRQIRQKGLAYVPEDRMGMGLVTPLNFMDNLILTNYYRNFSYGFLNFFNLLNYGVVKEWAKKIISDYEIKTGDINKPVKNMSGGNLQKLLLAREFSGDPALIIAVCPSRGLDVSATENARKLIALQRDKGTAVLLISEDLDEIFQLSDRIAVLYEGKIMGILDIKDATLEKVGLLMGGSQG